MCNLGNKHFESVIVDQGNVLVVHCFKKSFQNILLLLNHVNSKLAKIIILIFKQVIYKENNRSIQIIKQQESMKYF